MTFDRPSPVTELTQELRFATTMTGGVSLAIWMGGVAREINLLSQASQWRRAGGTFPTHSHSPRSDCFPQALRGTHRPARHGRRRRHLVWDKCRWHQRGFACFVASHGVDLGGLRDLWLELGALTDLLRDPRDKSTPSLLYGDERMFAALAKSFPSSRPGRSRLRRSRGSLAPLPPPCTSRRPCLPERQAGSPTRSARSSRTSTGVVSSPSPRPSSRRMARYRRWHWPLAAPLRSPPRSSPPSFPSRTEPRRRGACQLDQRWRPSRTSHARTGSADGGLLDNRPIDVLLERIFDRPARPAGSPGAVLRRTVLRTSARHGERGSTGQRQRATRARRRAPQGPGRDHDAVDRGGPASDPSPSGPHGSTDGHQTAPRRARGDAASRIAASHHVPADDYGTREATKQARALASALLRQLSTWPRASSTSTESIPQNWEKDLAVGGDAENVCRRQITESILSRWSQPPGPPLPQSPADLARYGQAAYDLAKGCALAVAGAAYQLAKSDADITALGKLTEDIHRAGAPPEPSEGVEGAAAVQTDRMISVSSFTRCAPPRRSGRGHSRTPPTCSLRTISNNPR